jgi:hypothetical protein
LTGGVRPNVIFERKATYFEVWLPYRTADRVYAKAIIRRREMRRGVSNSQERLVGAMIYYSSILIVRGKGNRKRFLSLEFLKAAGRPFLNLMVLHPAIPAFWMVNRNEKKIQAFLYEIYNGETRVILIFSFHRVLQAMDHTITLFCFFDLKVTHVNL